MLNVQHVPLSMFGDFETLFIRANAILNRYGGLFTAMIHETQIIGHDDDQCIFKCVEEKIQRDEEAIEREEEIKPRAG